MYDDIESDFWKDIFVHMQHKNMVRTDGNIMSVSEAPKIFERFSLSHPEFNPEVTITSSYATWELFLTDNIKLRLYIQNGIKASLLQKNGEDLVKIADAKFRVNPFPEIEEIIKTSHTLNQELNKNIEENIKYKKQQKLTSEFIKAILKTKLNGKNIIWNLNICQKDFKLEIQKNSDTKSFDIHLHNYKNDLDSILYSIE